MDGLLLLPSPVGFWTLPCRIYRTFNLLLFGLCYHSYLRSLPSTVYITLYLPQFYCTTLDWLILTTHYRAVSSDVRLRSRLYTAVVNPTACTFPAWFLDCQLVTPYLVTVLRTPLVRTCPQPALPAYRLPRFDHAAHAAFTATCLAVACRCLLLTVTPAPVRFTGCLLQLQLDCAVVAAMPATVGYLCHLWMVYHFCHPALQDSPSKPFFPLPYGLDMVYDGSRYASHTPLHIPLCRRCLLRVATLRLRAARLVYRPCPTAPAPPLWFCANADWFMRLLCSASWLTPHYRSLTNYTLRLTCTACQHARTQPAAFCAGCNTPRRPTVGFLLDPTCTRRTHQFHGLWILPFPLPVQRYGLCGSPTPVFFTALRSPSARTPSLPLPRLPPLPYPITDSPLRCPRIAPRCWFITLPRVGSYPGAQLYRLDCLQFWFCSFTPGWFHYTRTLPRFAPRLTLPATHGCWITLLRVYSWTAVLAVGLYPHQFLPLPARCQRLPIRCLVVLTFNAAHARYTPAAVARIPPPALLLPGLPRPCSGLCGWLTVGTFCRAFLLRTHYPLPRSGSVTPTFIGQHALWTSRFARLAVLLPLRTTYTRLCAGPVFTYCCHWFCFCTIPVDNTWFIGSGLRAAPCLRCCRAALIPGYMLQLHHALPVLFTFAGLYPVPVTFGSLLVLLTPFVALRMLV